MQKIYDALMESFDKDLVDQLKDGITEIKSKKIALDAAKKSGDQLAATLAALAYSHEIDVQKAKAAYTLDERDETTRLYETLINSQTPAQPAPTAPAPTAPAPTAQVPVQVQSADGSQTLTKVAAIVMILAAIALILSVLAIVH